MVLDSPAFLVEPRSIAVCSPRTAELAGSSIPVRGPVIPAEILDSPTTSSVTRSFSSWAPMPRTVGAKQFVWRMARFIGLHPANELPDSLVVRDDSMSPGQHSDRGWQSAFSSSTGTLAVPNRRIRALRSSSGKPVRSVMARSIGTSSSTRPIERPSFAPWETCAREGAPIGQPLSWERTARMWSPPCACGQRLACRLNVWSLGFRPPEPSSSIATDPDLLIFDPQSQEGDWERSRPGQQFGTGTMLVDTLAWEFALQGAETDVRSCGAQRNRNRSRCCTIEATTPNPSQAGMQIAISDRSHGGIDTERRGCR